MSTDSFVEASMLILHTFDPGGGGAGGGGGGLSNQHVRLARHRRCVDVNLNMLYRVTRHLFD